MLGRFREGKVTALRFGGVRPFGVKPRSVGQQFLQEALLLPAAEAPLAIIQGPAGTAKTFYALAAGLEQVLEAEERPYRKILVCRPNAQFDADIGFLPGSEQEKISPLMRPIVDNLEILLDLEGKKKERRSEEELRGRIDYLFDTGVIAAEAMNFMRGRSITDTWLIIDEAQNLTPRQVKGIITRVGKGHQGGAAGGPGPDRPPPAGHPEQRIDLRQRPHEGQPPVRPADHAPRRVRAFLFGSGRGDADVNEGRTYITRQIRKFIYILQDFGGRIYIPVVHCACVREKHTHKGRKKGKKNAKKKPPTPSPRS